MTPGKELAKSFNALYGKPCWGTRVGMGPSVTFEFGSPSLFVREPIRSDSLNASARRHLARRVITVRGEWHLWLYGCAWRLLDGDTVIARSSDSKRVREDAVKWLDGQAISGVAFYQGGSNFDFDLGGRIETVPDRGAVGKEQWMLYEPSENVSTYFADGTFERKHEKEA